MHAPVRGEAEIVRDALIAVADTGRIETVLKPEDDGFERLLSEAKDAGRLTVHLDHAFLLPGFVDLHIHAPQWPQLGKALDVPLEVWLQEHTFPLEARYADVAFAQRIYSNMVESLLAHGTTTALYFATIHLEATKLLAEICADKGQRALVGKVVMDNPDQCPDYYRDASTEQAVTETASFIEHVNGLKNPRVKPVITPRFIPSCTDEALQRLGTMVKETGCHVQTHCSESDWQHGYVLDRTGKSDTNALKDFGLMGRHTVLAHSNFISETDMETIHDCGAGVAHCPLSNIYFSNAVFPLARALEKSVRVGLGTDISGGPSASMLDACRHAVHSSRMLEEGVDPTKARDDRRLEESRIDFRTAFHLATAGGADVLDLPVGAFEAGRQFDAILVDPQAQSAPILIDDELDTLDDQLQKIIMTATRANIVGTWVGGVQVSGLG